MTIRTTDRVPIPRKLNPGMIEALSLAIAKGNYAVTASRLCGIDEHTLMNWTNQGLADILAGRENLYTQLVSALKEAEAQSETDMVELVRNTAVEKKDGYLGMTYLERRHPDRWGRRERKTIEINEHRVIEVTHVEVIKDRGPDITIEPSTPNLLT